MKKRIFKTLIVSTLIMSLMACGKEETKNDNKTQTESVEDEKESKKETTDEKKDKEDMTTETESETGSETESTEENSSQTTDKNANVNNENANSKNTNNGNANSGNVNSGNANSGNANSGNANSGNANSGNANSGNANSGNANSGNTNSTTGKANLYSRHGALSVSGANLVDKNGNKFQLYGMSTHGITWFPEYVNYDTFKTLRDDWNTNCIRLALYTAEYNGYCTGGNQTELKNLVKNGVSYATSLDMYVIIDWHVLNDQNPNNYKEQAKAFFNEMSSTYASYDNIIYEICNEPNGSTSWEEIKSYANEVIPVIRANDPNAVIIVGTPTWSQEIDKAKASPLGYGNVMYALHFYAATHTDWLRNRMTECINAGLPVFISEFGICDASGNGAIDYTQANEWMKVITNYNVSYMAWNLANKAETSSIIKSGVTQIAGWSDGQLTESGIWYRSQFRAE